MPGPVVRWTHKQFWGRPGPVFFLSIFQVLGFFRTMLLTLIITNVEHSKITYPTLWILAKSGQFIFGPKSFAPLILWKKAILCMNNLYFFELQTKKLNHSSCQQNQNLMTMKILNQDQPLLFHKL